MNGDEKRAWVEENLRDLNPAAVYFDGLEDAIVGYAQQFSGEPLVVYDFDQIIDLLMAEGSDREDAIDHFGYNIQGTWAGEGTPLILYRIDEEDGTPLSVPGVPGLWEPPVPEGLGDVPPVREEEPRVGGV